MPPSGFSDKAVKGVLVFLEACYEDLLKEINSDSKNVEVEASVVEVGEPRTVNTRFGPRQVATAVIEDETGRINLSLWEKQIETVKNASKLKIEGAYVTEWNGNLQLNLSKQSVLQPQ